MPTMIEIQGIRNRLARIPYSLYDVEAREAAERLCQEAEAAAASGDGVRARTLAFYAGARSDEVRS
jgi:hypothetical protein